MKQMSTFLVIAIVFLFFGFSSAIAQDATAKKIFRSISPVDAMRMLQQRDDIVFLDVRTPEERSRGYVPGSQLVSFNDVAMGKLPIPKDKAILLVCAVGGRSYFAGKMLSTKGYKEVYNLSGGVKKWYQSGLPLTHDK